MSLEVLLIGGICEINLFLIVKIENIIFVSLYFVLFFYLLVQFHIRSLIKKKFIFQHESDGFCNLLTCRQMGSAKQYILFFLKWSIIINYVILPRLWLMVLSLKNIYCCRYRQISARNSFKVTVAACSLIKSILFPQSLISISPELSSRFTIFRFEEAVSMTADVFRKWKIIALKNETQMNNN